MEHAQLLPHLADGLRMILNGSQTTPSGPLRFAPARYLAIHRMKWPEGKIEAPQEAFKTESRGFEEDRAAVLGLLHDYMNRAPATLSKTHPSFGRMKPADWDVLLYRHMDHHLRQFSC